MSKARSIKAAREGFAEILNEAHYLNSLIPIKKHDRPHAYIVGPEFLRSYVDKMIKEKSDENEEAKSYDYLIEQVAQDIGWSIEDVREMMERSDAMGTEFGSDTSRPSGNSKTKS